MLICRIFVKLMGISGVWLLSITDKLFFEILNSPAVAVIEEVDERHFTEFVCRLNRYLTEYAPDDDDFKQYVEINATYLTFIKKKPMHPVGMAFSQGKAITYKNNKFYCPMKNWQSDTLSLCEYCITNDFSKS